MCAVLSVLEVGLDLHSWCCEGVSLTSVSEQEHSIRVFGHKVQKNIVGVDGSFISNWFRYVELLAEIGEMEYFGVRSDKSSNWAIDYEPANQEGYGCVPPVAVIGVKCD